MECLRRHPRVQKLENNACSRRVNAQEYQRADLPVGYFHLWVIQRSYGKNHGQRKRNIFKRLEKQSSLVSKRSIAACISSHKSEGGSMVEDIWIQIKEEEKRSDIIMGLDHRLP